MGFVIASFEERFNLVGERNNLPLSQGNETVRSVVGRKNIN